MRKIKIWLALLMCAGMNIYPSKTNTVQYSEKYSKINTTESMAITNNIEDIYIEERETQGEDVNVFLGYSSIPLESETQIQISDICIRYEIPFELMLGIAKQESAFDTEAFNEKSGDYGLFQINAKTWDKTADELGLRGYKTDVVQNAEMACHIFDYCLKRAEGDVRIALNYYRTGTPNNKYEADSDYATIVLSNYKNIKESEWNDYYRLQQIEH